jgi:hypothetical protein
VFSDPSRAPAVNLGHEFTKRPDRFWSHLALTSVTIRSTTARASDADISLTKPITRLFLPRSTHHVATQRPRCFFTDPF